MASQRGEIAIRRPSTGDAAVDGLFQWIRRRHINGGFFGVYRAAGPELAGRCALTLLSRCASITDHRLVQPSGRIGNLWNFLRGFLSPGASFVGSFRLAMWCLVWCFIVLAGALCCTPRDRVFFTGSADILLCPLASGVWAGAGRIYGPPAPGNLRVTCFVTLSIQLGCTMRAGKGEHT
jgi:hypothetical protein